MLGGERMSWYLSDLFLPAAAAFAASLVVRRLMPADGAPLAQVASIGTSIAASGVAAALASSALRPLLLRRLGRIAGGAPA